MPSFLITAIIVLILCILGFLALAIMLGHSVIQTGILTNREDIRSNCCSVYNCSSSVPLSSINCKVGNTTKTFKQWLDEENIQSAQDFCWCNTS
jgi:hypothetical protein